MNNSININNHGNGKFVNDGIVSNVISESSVVSQSSDLKESSRTDFYRLLSQLQQMIKEEALLSTEDKGDLLEQLENLEKANQVPDQTQRKSLIRRAQKIFEATLKGLPETAKILEACSKLLPMLLKML